MRGLVSCLGLGLSLVACGGRFDASKDAGPGTPNADAAVGPACVASATPELVASIDGRSEPLALVAAGGFVFYGAHNLVADPDKPYTGELGRVREHDGARDIIQSGYAGGLLASDGVDLFYFDGIVQRPQNKEEWWTKETAVIARPVAGGEARVIGTPGPYSDQGLRTFGGRGVVFGDEIDNGNFKTAGVARWDGSLTTQLVTSSDLYHYLGWNADADGVYWNQRTSGDDSLVTTPLSGGATRLLAQGVYGFPVATDADTVYMVQQSVLSATIVAVAKNGGVVRPLAPKGDYGSTVVLDRGWLYYVDYKEQGHRIWRVRTSGGAPELFAEDADPSTLVRSIAVSACAIYWTEGSYGNGTRLMRKAR